MKKLIWALLLLIGPAARSQTVSILSQGQLGISCNAVTASTSTNPGLAGGCTSFNLLTSGGALPGIYTWQVTTTGSPSSTSVTLVGSLDGVTWTTLDTNTSTGSRTTSSTAAYRFLGCVPGTLSGGTSPTLTCQISVTNTPSSGGLPGSGTGPFTATSTLALPNGTNAAPALAGATGNPALFWNTNNGDELLFTISSSNDPYGISVNNGFTIASAWVVGWVSGSNNVDTTATPDTSVNRCSAGVLCAGKGNTSNDASGTFKAAAYQTNTNCSSSAAPAVCGAAAAGSVVIAAAATTVTVDTTAVTANSQILLQTDDTLGTKLSVTCNSTTATLVGGVTVTARTAATSFQITSGATPATNPLCISYWIVN